MFTPLIKLSGGVRTADLAGCSTGLSRPNNFTGYCGFQNFTPVWISINLGISKFSHDSIGRYLEAVLGSSVGNRYDSRHFNSPSFTQRKIRKNTRQFNFKSINFRLNSVFEIYFLKFYWWGLKTLYACNLRISYNSQTKICMKLISNMNLK